MGGVGGEDEVRTLRAWLEGGAWGGGEGREREQRFFCGLNIGRQGPSLCYFGTPETPLRTPVVNHGLPRLVALGESPSLHPPAPRT